MTQHFRYYTIGEASIVLCDNHGILSEQGDGGKILAQTDLSEREALFMERLLSWYPDPCPYPEHIHIACGWSEENCMRLYRVAQTNKTMTKLLSPVVGTIAKLRPKLTDFSIDIALYKYIGYCLCERSQFVRVA